MKTFKFVAIVGLALISFIQTSNANPVVERGTSLSVVLTNSVQVDGSTPVTFRIVSPGALSSAKLEGEFNPNSKAWVLVSFARIVLPNGIEMPLGKVQGSDVYGTESIEMLQSQRSEWAAYIGKSNIPAGTHFNVMLTTNLNVPSFTKTLAMAH